MGNKNPNPHEFQEEIHQIKNHTVRIRKSKNVEKLWIDDQPHKILKTKAGYNLYEDAYVPPSKTLLDAVKAFINKKS